MELWKDALLVLGRIITIVPFLLLITLFMGRRSIGELPIFDFLVVLTLGAVVGADIADPKIGHIHTAIAIAGIGLLQKAVTYMKIKSRKAGRWLTFEPVIVIRDGEFLLDRLSQIQYTIDNILVMLREQNIFDIREVDTAVIESNGKLTVQKKSAHQTVTRRDMGITQPQRKGIFYPVIVEGKVYSDVLSALELDDTWLNRELNRKGITDPRQVFFASVSEDRQLSVSPYAPTVPSPPELRH